MAKKEVREINKAEKDNTVICITICIYTVFIHAKRVKSPAICL